jgi:CrcB protein
MNEEISRAALFHASAVGLGGFLGALARYGLSGWIHRQIPATTFPYGTLAVNLLGCLLIGVAAGLGEARGLLSPELRVFVLIGLLGGFTTFSTFGYETFAMVRDAELLRATGNVALHVIVGLSLVWAGYAGAMVVAR